MLNAWRDCSETLTRKQQSEMKAYFFCINNWNAFHVITWYIWAIVLFLIYVQYRKNLMSSRTCQVPSVPQQNLLDLVCFELENSNSPECTQFKYALFSQDRAFSTSVSNSLAAQVSQTEFERVTYVAWTRTAGRAARTRSGRPAEAAASAGQWCTRRWGPEGSPTADARTRQRSTGRCRPRSWKREPNKR